MGYLYQEDRAPAAPKPQSCLADVVLTIVAMFAIMFFAALIQPPHRASSGADEHSCIGIGKESTSLVRESFSRRPEVEEGAELRIKLVEVGLHDIESGVGKLNELDIAVAGRGGAQSARR